MKKLLTILAALAILASGPVNAQAAQKLTATRLDLSPTAGWNWNPATKTFSVVPGSIAANNVTATALATPGSITVAPQGTPGSTTVTYKLVALLADGTTTEAGAASTTTTSAATLNGTNFNRLTWSAVTGASSYRVYRTGAPTTPNTTGIIYSGTALTVDDTGLAGGGETAPTVNGTGVITASRFVGAGVGISNSAGANVIPKSDGTNLVASSITDDGTTLTGTGSGGINFTNAGAAYKISVSGQPVLSISRDGSIGGLTIAEDATRLANFGLSSLSLGSTYPIGWSNGVVSQPIDVFLRRRGAANPAWGVAAASPVPYTHTLAEDASSADTSGGNATLTPGIGRGTGAASRLLLGGPLVGSTGSAVQSTATPVSIGGEVKADGTESFINVTGTLPASGSAETYGTKIAVTGAGTAAYPQTALRVDLAAGYTGVYNTAAVYGKNASAVNNPGAVMTQGVVGEASSAKENVGVFGKALAAADVNIGIGGTAATGSSNSSVGVFGGVNPVSGTEARAYGVVGILNAGNTSAGIASGLIAAGSAAAMFDNRDAGLPILLAKDNGTTVFSINDGGAICGGLSKTLTESSATGFVEIAVASNNVVSAHIDYEVEANDATDYQVLSGTIRVNAVNKAGTVTASIAEVGTQTSTLSTGTLTVTNTVLAGTAKITVRSNAVSSLTQTTLRIKYMVRAAKPIAVTAL